MAGNVIRGCLGSSLPTPGPISCPDPLGLKGAYRGRPDQWERKSLYFLRTNGNKLFLFISWCIVEPRGCGGRGYSP